MFPSSARCFFSFSGLATCPFPQTHTLATPERFGFTPHRNSPPSPPRVCGTDSTQLLPPHSAAAHLPPLLPLFAPFTNLPNFPRSVDRQDSASVAIAKLPLFLPERFFTPPFFPPHDLRKNLQLGWFLVLCFFYVFSFPVFVLRRRYGGS